MRFKILDSTYISHNNNNHNNCTHGNTHICIQKHIINYNNEMFNNTSTVGPSKKAIVVVTNYMGTLVLFLESAQGANSVSMMNI